MVLVAGIAVHVMPCHDCGIYSKHLCIVYHDACEKKIFCMLYNAVFVYLYLYGLWPEIKSYYYYYYYYYKVNALFQVELLFQYYIDMAMGNAECA